MFILVGGLLTYLSSSSHFVTPYAVELFGSKSEIIEFETVTILVLYHLALVFLLLTNTIEVKSSYPKIYGLCHPTAEGRVK